MLRRVSGSQEGRKNTTLFEFSRFPQLLVRDQLLRSLLVDSSFRHRLWRPDLCVVSCSRPLPQEETYLRFILILFRAAAISCMRGCSFSGMMSVIDRTLEIRLARVGASWSFSGVGGGCAQPRIRPHRGISGPSRPNPPQFPRPPPTWS